LDIFLYKLILNSVPIVSISLSSNIICHRLRQTLISFSSDGFGDEDDGGNNEIDEDEGVAMIGDDM